MKNDQAVETKQPLRVVVLGGGVGGTRVANLLARQLRGRGAVELVTASPRHVYQPALLFAAFPDLDPVEWERPEADLLRSEVVLYAEAPAVRIDPAQKRVSLATGQVLTYDYLVVATGAEPAPALLPGVGQAHSLRNADQARALARALSNLDGGRVVIATPPGLRSNPAGPMELAFLAADFLERWGLPNQLVLTCPGERLFPSAEVSEQLETWLAERGVRIQRGFVPRAVEGQRLLAADGRAEPFRVLAMEPPERGVAAVRDSGLGDAEGWLRCDPHSLRVEHLRDVWALGECSALEVARWPSSATHQAAVIAESILAEYEGRAPRPRDAIYDGRAEVFLEVGHGRVAFIEHDYSAGYRLHPPTPLLAAGKRTFDKAYWHLGPTGLL
jgi:sulfide:quinone oxidoreductase